MANSLDVSLIVLAIVSPVLYRKDSSFQWKKEVIGLFGNHASVNKTRFQKRIS